MKINFSAVILILTIVLSTEFSSIASAFRIDIVTENEKEVYHVNGGKSKSLKDIEEILNAFKENEKDQIIVVDADESVKMGEIINVLKLIKNAGFKEVLFISRKKESDKHLSWLAIPIDLKKLSVNEVFDIPTAPPEEEKEKSSSIPLLLPDEKAK